MDLKAPKHNYCAVYHYKDGENFVPVYFQSKREGMNRLKVIKVDSESIEFENGVTLSSNHESDCCEHHWLSFGDLTIDDFKDLEFDLTNDDFFKRIEDYGIELIPIQGYSIKVPGYGSNNGYYSSNLSLDLSGNGISKTYDITSCQVISD